MIAGATTPTEYPLEVISRKLNTAGPQAEYHRSCTSEKSQKLNCIPEVADPRSCISPKLKIAGVEERDHPLNAPEVARASGGLTKSRKLHWGCHLHHKQQSDHAIHQNADPPRRASGAHGPLVASAKSTKLYWWPLESQTTTRPRDSPKRRPVHACRRASGGLGKTRKAVLPRPLPSPTTIQTVDRRKYRPGRTRASRSPCH